MGLDKRQRYIAGSTVQKIQPAKKPKERSHPRRHARQRHQEQRKVQYVNVFYSIFLTAAACMVLWSCVTYLQLQAESTGRIKKIASLETQLEELRKENDDNYTRLMTSVDLDHIRDVAVNELGMVYADEEQVILYDGGTRDYVRQNKEIPEKEQTLLEQILGK